MRDEIKEMLELKIDLSLSQKCVLSNLFLKKNYMALFTYIYIEHKRIIGLWSNGITKAREKIEP